MAKKHNGNRSEEREEIAAEVDEALSAAEDEFAGTITEQAGPGGEYRAEAHDMTADTGTGLGEEPLGDYEPAETPGEALLSERAEPQSEQSAEGARAAADEARPQGLGASLGGLIHQGVYSGFYGLSFGLTFGALLVSQWMPPDSAVAEGVRDGAEAARHALKGGLRSTTADDGMAAGTA
jgi:hypothetical protein